VPERSIKELEAELRERASARDAKLVVEPADWRAAFTLSPDVVATRGGDRLSVRGTDKRQALENLLALDEATPPDADPEAEPDAGV
jgi:hypothetical protein